MGNDYFGNHNSFDDRRTGPVNRRTGLTDTRRDQTVENRKGLPDRRMSTKDKDITIVTSSGEYKGTINLNAAPVLVDRISDFFIKSEFRFVTLYNTVLIGRSGKVALVNVKDIAIVIPHEQFTITNPELRQDADVTLKMKFGIGQLMGKVNLMGESQQMDRVSDLLNYPAKRWLVVYDATFKGKPVQAAIVNMEFISIVEG